MRKNGFLCGVLFLGVLLAGCVTGKISSDYDHSVDFSKLKAYAWEADPKPTGDPRFDDPELQEAIKSAVETELQAKGFQKDVSGNPDLIVKYHITTKEEQKFIDSGAAPTFNARGVWTGGTGQSTYGGLSTMVFHYEEGTFVLDMLDPRSGVVIWRGTLEDMVNPAVSQARRIERVPEAIARVLKDFPPVKK